MIKLFINKYFLSGLILLIAGCSPANQISTPTKIVIYTAIPASIPTEIPANNSTNIPTMTISPESTQTELSFIPTTYRDENNHFQLDYPAGWELIPYKQIGSRGGQAQVYSPGSTAEKLLSGGTRFTISVYDWDPKNDLTAYVNQRKIAMEASDQKIVSDGEGMLADGRKEMHFIVESPEKEKSFLLYTTVGEKYLQIAGDGDLTLIEEIARTLRPLE
jgi:hypothetical protein